VLPVFISERTNWNNAAYQSAALKTSFMFRANGLQILANSPSGEPLSWAAFWLKHLILA
jgi:hypothetical protein